MIVGYARTSTVEQEAGFEAQKRDLETTGCTKLFAEQLSSVDARRPQLEAALEFVREGDVFVVTKLDRLARSVAGFIKIVGDLERKKVAGVDGRPNLGRSGCRINGRWLRQGLRREGFRRRHRPQGARQSALGPE
jgi:DNA invertase Pin-like site-specific DNA recombinase